MEQYCPICGEIVNVISTYYDGEGIEYELQCDSCGYHWDEIRNLTEDTEVYIGIEI